MDVNNTNNQTNSINFIQKVERVQIHLESIYGTKLNGSKNSNILFYLKSPIEIKGHILDVSVSVYSFIMPIAFYIVNENNNKLNIEIDNVIYSYTIPVGNYNINELITKLKQLIGNNFNISINTSTYKLTITNFINEFKILGNSSCWRLLGFNKDENLQSSSLTLSLPNVVNLTGVNMVKIWSPSFNLKNIDGKTGNQSSILQSISVTGIQGGIINYLNNTGFKSSCKEKTFSTLLINLKDEFDEYLNLNGADFQLVLELEYLYNKEIKDESFLGLTGKDF
jgi:hypothetical protein